MVYPTNLLQEIRLLVGDGEELLGVLDPHQQLTPALQRAGIKFVDLAETELDAFHGKLALVGPCSRWMTPNGAGWRNEFPSSPAKCGGGLDATANREAGRNLAILFYRAEKYQCRGDGASRTGGWFAGQSAIATQLDLFLPERAASATAPVLPDLSLNP